MEGDVEKIGKAARAHFEIENSEHLSFECHIQRRCLPQIRKDNAPENLSVIRHFAINLLSKHKGKQSMRRLTIIKSRQNLNIL